MAGKQIGGVDSSHLDSVLIVGFGFVGSSLTKHLVRAGVRVRVLVRSEISDWVKTENPSVEFFVSGNIASERLQEELLDVDCVIWCAGSALPAELEADVVRCIDSRVEPLQAMLDKLRHRPTTFALVSSGGAVYGDVQSGAAKESTVPSPITAYGIANLTAEFLVSRHGYSSGTATKIFRCSNIYSQFQPVGRSQGLIANAIDCAVSRRRLQIYGDGSSTRDYIHIDDVCQSVYAILANHMFSGIVNIGSGIGTTINDVVESISAITGTQVEVEYQQSRQGDLHRCVLDNERQVELTGIVPRPLESGIAQIWHSLVMEGR